MTASRPGAHSRSTGADSPVTADSSTIATPSITLPSHGMTPPGSITMMSPRTSSAAGFVRPSKIVATASAWEIRGASGRPWDCRPPRSLPIRTNTTPDWGSQGTTTVQTSATATGAAAAERRRRDQRPGRRPACRNTEAMLCSLTGRPHRLSWMRSAWWCHDCRQKIESCCEGGGYPSIACGP